MPSNLEALTLLNEDIKSLLGDDNATDRELIKGVLRAQRSMLPFMYQGEEDHGRVRTMWLGFYPIIGFTTTLAGGLGTLLWKIFTGEWKITRP